MAKPNGFVYCCLCCLYVVYSVWTRTCSHQSWSSFCWGRKEYIQQVSCRILRAWDHVHLLKLRYNAWHGRCSRSCLAELLVVYGHLPGSTWFLQGPDWCIKQTVIGAVTLVSFGSIRVALISTIPPSHTVFDVQVGFCLTFPTMVALTPQIRDPGGGVTVCPFCQFQWYI